MKSLAASHKALLIVIARISVVGFVLIASSIVKSTKSPVPNLATAFVGLSEADLIRRFGAPIETILGPRNQKTLIFSAEKDANTLFVLGADGKVSSGYFRGSAFVYSSDSSSESTAAAPAPRLVVTVTEAELRGLGPFYLVVEGTVKNVGTDTARRPSMTIEVYDGATLVGTDTAYVVGLRDVPPGSSAAFSSNLHVVGRPDDPRWRVVINAHAGEVKYASPKVRSMGFSRVDGGYPDLVLK